MKTPISPGTLLRLAYDRIGFVDRPRQRNTPAAAELYAKLYLPFLKGAPLTVLSWDNEEAYPRWMRVLTPDGPLWFVYTPEAFLHD